MHRCASWISSSREVPRGAAGGRRRRRPAVEVAGGDPVSGAELAEAARRQRRLTLDPPIPSGVRMTTPLVRRQNLPEPCLTADLAAPTLGCGSVASSSTSLEER